MSDELMVYLRHIKAAGYCIARGAKPWFEHHGLDWRDFIRNGIPASRILAANDSLSALVVEIAQKERESGNGQG